MVVDKETKMRETLKIMSATRTTYTLSYYLTQGFFVLISSLFVCIGMLWTQNRTNNIGAGPKLLIGAVTLFGSGLISIAMALTTLFTDSKLSPQVGMYLLLLPTSIFFYMMTNRMQLIGHPDNLGYQLFPLTYLLPNFSFSVIMLEFYIKGGAQLLLGLNVNVAWWCLGLSTPFYLMVYMYLDGIIPNAFGISESLLFCLKCRKKARFENDDNFADNEALFN